MKKIIVLILILNCLMGCKKEEPVFNVCVANDYSSVELYSLNDEIYRSVEKQNFTYEELGINSNNEDEWIASFKDYYESIEGVKTSVEKAEDSLILSIEIDYSINFEALKEKGLVEENLSHLSLKKSIEALENSGFSCKEVTIEE